jgi:glycosyltransferase involved in cell wall biosynthesis
MIGATLARTTRLPWIADFRDPMVEYLPGTGEAFPSDPNVRSARLRIEERTARLASRLVFCTNSARGIVAERYSSLAAENLEVIPNGYEEQAFRAAERLVSPSAATTRRVLLHSGTIYPGADRDPTALMQAISTLCINGTLNPDNFELRLRDPSNQQHFQKLAEDFGIARVVTILGPLPYKEALAEMLSADGLLLLQGYTSNPAIPAKLYEYLRARRPILALVHPDGETATLLRTLGLKAMARLDDADAIGGLLTDWSADATHELPSNEVVAEFSRELLTARLAGLFDEVTKSSSQTGRFK